MRMLLLGTVYGATGFQEKITEVAGVSIRRNSDQELMFFLDRADDYFSEASDTLLDVLDNFTGLCGSEGPLFHGDPHVRSSSAAC
jgi:hypothetical protein